MAETALGTLFRDELTQAGLRPIDLVRLAGYRNEAKGLRRFEQICRGDPAGQREVVERFARAFAIPQDRFESALATTRQALDAAASEEERQREARWRASFVAHAVIIPARSVPRPIFIAALVGVERLLRIDFDTSKRRATFAQQVVARLPTWVPAFGPPIGFVVNYEPDRAVRFDLAGQAVELLPKAIRCAEAGLSVSGREVPQDFL